MAAEIRGNSRGRPRNPALSFNEAAANGRGNPLQPPVYHTSQPASMRPRRMAAEIPCGPVTITASLDQLQ